MAGPLTHFTTNFAWSTPPAYIQQRVIPDAISIVSPGDAILQNSLSHTSTATLQYQWQMLQPPLDTAANTNIIDSVPAASETPTLSVFPTNTCYQDDIMVQTNLVPRMEAQHMSSGDMHLVQTALSLEKLVKRQEINLAMGEYTVGTTGAAADTAGLFQWTFEGGLGRARTTDVALGATTLAYGYNPTLVKHASGTPMSEASFEDGIQQAAYLGNQINAFQALMAPGIHRRFRDFAGIFKPTNTEQSQIRYNRSLESRMAGYYVDFYETASGIVELVPIPEWGRTVQTFTTSDVNSLGTMAVTSDNCIIALDPAYVQIREFQGLGFFSFETPTDGRNTATVLSYLAGFQCDNGRALIGYYNCDGTDATVA